MSFKELDIYSPELASVISYPPLSFREYTNRLKEICSLGITHVLPIGRTKIGKMTIAGKGSVGIVLKVKIEGKIHALKIRRTDANRETMQREISLHKIANSVDVGPKLSRFSENLIVMEFIDGLSILDWVKQQDITADEGRNIAISILEQCYNLDKAHMDHGELSCINHHIIISKSNTANIIDFESSSTQRKSCNVTAAAQSLFISEGLIANRMNELLGSDKKEKIIQILKTYKWNQVRVNFDKIIDTFC
ncbi:MAG TPA: RIO1 family regulatory kinase/ATPase [Nitrososphaeraceae archaeon]|nr:RIO1 family regulatory kinase/ATPase [Nitrososphaeraceae archaeon]